MKNLFIFIFISISNIGYSELYKCIQPELNIPYYSSYQIPDMKCVKLNTPKANCDDLGNSFLTPNDFNLDAGTCNSKTTRFFKKIVNFDLYKLFK